MFVAVVRADLSKALFIADVEPKSTANPSVEPPLGQNRYINRPDPARLTTYCLSQGFALGGTTIADLITATVPVGLPAGIDLRPATIRAVGGGGGPFAGATNAQVLAMQNLLAYHFVETDLVKKSFLYGNLAGFRAATFSPDPRRPTGAPAAGAAIGCVIDTGLTPFAVAIPIVAGARLNFPAPGNFQIGGVGMAAYGAFEVTVVLSGTGARNYRLDEILAAGGDVSDTIINLPMTVLLPGVAATVTQARVRVNDMLSNRVNLT
jgi:hypothetical protein